MSFVTGNSIILELCERLNLDPTQTHRIVIDIPSDGVIQVFVEGYPHADQIPHTLLNKLVDDAKVNQIK
jgi:hypothetical protein